MKKLLQFASALAVLAGFWMVMVPSLAVGVLVMALGSIVFLLVVLPKPQTRSTYPKAIR